MNDTDSMVSEDTTRSSVNISDMSSIAHHTRPLGISMTCQESVCGISSIVSEDDPSKTTHTLESSQSFEGSDNVFYSDISSQDEIEDFRNASEGSESYNKQTCYTCHGRTGRERNCSECQSHLKFPSRQEKITDDTPQMHRSNESVWNSYAAKNLRSLRYGMYSEDSDGDKENVETISAVSHGNEDEISNSGVTQHIDASKTHSNNGFYNILTQKIICDRASAIRHKARQLRKTKSFSYPSDDEDSDSEWRKYTNRGQLPKKRGFSDVDQSPVRRTHSADSGLTQEFRLLRCQNGEPLYKRTSSLPRTRIRFHSGHGGTHTVEKSNLLLDAHTLADTQNCLDQISSKCRNLSDSDNMTMLSADEKRLVEGHSDTSISEQDSIHVTEGEDKVSDSHIEHSESDGTKAESVATGMDSYRGSTNLEDTGPTVEMHEMENFKITDQPLKNKTVGALQRQMMSSLRSSGECRELSLNLSSIHDVDENAMDVSGFTPSEHKGVKTDHVNR